MSVTARPPSVAWEPVPVPECPPYVLWAWFQPQGRPLDVLIQVPPETRAACGGAMSVRWVLRLLGIDAVAVDSWSVQGATFPGSDGANPLLVQPLPSPGPWGDPGIVIRMRPLTSPQPSPPRGIPSAAPTANLPTPSLETSTADGTLAAFAADWNALLVIETQLSAVRKQLGALQGQLQSLNRDLSSDEQVAADSQDKKDWQDSRRWLRDSFALVSRYIRDHDIGMVSAAGNRNRFEQIYNKHVVPMKRFEGLMAVHQEFEQHRKTAQHLLIQMQAAHQNASRDGVNRARQLLGRIGAKVKKAKEKRGTRSKR